MRWGANRTVVTGQDDRMATHCVPAWAYSVGLHAAILLLVGLWLRLPPRQALVPEQARSASIVLTQRQLTGEVAYFDQDHYQHQVNGHDQLVPQLSANQRPLALPSIEQGSLLPQIELPSEQPPAVADSGTLVARPGDQAVRSSRLLPQVGDQQAFIEAEQAARRAGLPTGPPGRVSVFGSSTAVGHSFVFVIDRSQSMGEDGLGVLEAAQHELEAALAKLLPTHSFQIIAYNQQTLHFGDRRLKPATEENRRLATRFVGELAAYGRTEHQTALMSALFMHPDVIFLLTDGGYPELNAGQLRLIQRQAGRRTTIHCLRFGFGPQQERDHFLMRLAADNGGAFTYVDMSAASHR